MAAAAWNENSDRVIKEVQKKLTRLQDRCRSPSDLERNVIRAQADARDLASAVRAYLMARPQASRVTMAMLENLNDRLEAFYEYVQLRPDHTDDEHMMGRVRMAQFVRIAIQEMIDYFDAI